MAVKISDDCISCDACTQECPNTAIYAGGEEWSMADGTNLAKAMIVAPIAGLAAAFGKFYLSSKEDK